MLFIVIFFAMAVLALCHIVYVASRGGKAKMVAKPLPPMPVDSTASLVHVVEKRREIKWISTKEFEGLLRNCEEIIFIDLRSQAIKESLFHSPWLTSSTSTRAIFWKY